MPELSLGDARNHTLKDGNRQAKQGLLKRFVYCSVVIRWEINFVLYLAHRYTTSSHEVMLGWKVSGRKPLEHMKELVYVEWFVHILCGPLGKRHVSAL